MHKLKKKKKLLVIFLSENILLWNMIFKIMKKHFLWEIVDVYFKIKEVEKILILVLIRSLL